MSEREGEGVPERSRPTLVVVIAIALLGLLAAEALAGVRIVMSAPELLWTELIGIVGPSLLAVLAPVFLRRQAGSPWTGVMRGGLVTVALAYATAYLVAMALAATPLEDFGSTLGLAVLAAIAGLAALAPAMVYVALKPAADAMIVIVLVAGCVLMPLPYLSGPILAGLLLWRRSVVARLP